MDADSQDVGSGQAGRPVLPGYRIIAVCTGGHSQAIQVDGSLGREFAEEQAGILDGTSEMYLVPPGPDSIIGKCGICGRKIHCTVEDLPKTAGAA